MCICGKNFVLFCLYTYVTKGYVSYYKTNTTKPGNFYVMSWSWLIFANSNFFNSHSLTHSQPSTNSKRQKNWQSVMIFLLSRADLHISITPLYYKAPLKYLCVHKHLFFHIRRLHTVQSSSCICNWTWENQAYMRIKFDLFLYLIITLLRKKTVVFQNSQIFIQEGRYPLKYKAGVFCAHKPGWYSHDGMDSQTGQ